MKSLYAAITSCIIFFVICNWMLADDVGQPSNPGGMANNRFVILNISDTCIWIDSVTGETRILSEDSAGRLGWASLPLFGKGEMEAGSVRPRRMTNPSQKSQAVSNVSKDSFESYLEQQGYQRIQMHRANGGYMSTQVTVDGKSMNLLIDTGAPSTHFDKSKAEKIGIQWRTYQKEGAEGKPDLSLRYCVVSSMQLGPLRVRELRVSAYDLSEVNRRIELHGGVPFDGLIGADLLGRYSAVIDYKTTSLYVLAK